MVNSFGVDAVVVRMGSDKFDVTDLEREMDGDDESVFIPRDVENNSAPMRLTGCLIAPRDNNVARRVDRDGVRERHGFTLLSRDKRQLGKI